LDLAKAIDLPKALVAGFTLPGVHDFAGHQKSADHIGN
jgi:hypothetical protein